MSRGGSATALSTYPGPRFPRRTTAAAIIASSRGHISQIGKYALSFFAGGSRHCNLVYWKNQVYMGEWQMRKKIAWNAAYFLAFLFFTAVEVAIALFVRDAFVRPYLGDVLVVVVVYCFARSFLPAWRMLPAGVFLFAAAIEVSQYFGLVARLGLQNNRVLAVMLGSTFDWADLLCYFCGCVLLFLWQWLLARRTAAA